jgi:hypothetical protein
MPESMTATPAQRAAPRPILDFCGNVEMCEAGITAVRRWTIKASMHTSRVTRAASKTATWPFFAKSKNPHRAKVKGAIITIAVTRLRKMIGFTMDGLSRMRKRAKPNVSGEEIRANEEQYRIKPKKNMTRATNGAVHGHGVISVISIARVDKRKMLDALIAKSVSSPGLHRARG